MHQKTTKFPEEFLWGASLSALQIEGRRNLRGKRVAVTDFDFFKRSHIQADIEVTSDLYRRQKEGIDYMAELGFRIYRFSIVQVRIIPDGNGAVHEEGIKFCNRIINYLLPGGIQPFVTLYHFDLPYALTGECSDWESRQRVLAFERYVRVHSRAFGDWVRYWQVHNEQNLMMRVNERINIDTADKWETDRLRAQMDYHMFLAHALAVKACHELVSGGEISPAVSSCYTYPETPRPEDMWTAANNNWFRAEYCLDMHQYDRYPGYYRRHLKERNIMPSAGGGGEEILKWGVSDYIAVNYYRTLCVRCLPVDEIHPVKERCFPSNKVDFDRYGYFSHMKNPHLVSTGYGAQIDPMGLQIVLNRYYQKYRLPLLITENGLRVADILTKGGKVHDSYRISYLREHIQACRQALDDDMELMGYSPWSSMDLLSSHEGFRKRYGFLYVDRSEHETDSLKRIKKDSFHWHRYVIGTDGATI